MQAGLAILMILGCALVALALDVSQVPGVLTPVSHSLTLDVILDDAESGLFLEVVVTEAIDDVSVANLIHLYRSSTLRDRFVTSEVFRLTMMRFFFSPFTT